MAGRSAKAWTAEKAEGRRGLLLRQRQSRGARRRSVRQRHGSGLRRRRRLRHQPRGAAHRRRRSAPRQQHRGWCRGDLRRDLGEVQGRLEHECDWTGARLTPAGPAALGTPRGKRGRELQRLCDLALAHALRPSGRRDLVPLGPELSRPCGGRVIIGCFRPPA